jgi:hypothetical protein
MRPSLFWGVVQRQLLVSGGRFGTIYRSHPQGLSILTTKSARCKFPEDLPSQQYVSNNYFAKQWQKYAQRYLTQRKSTVQGTSNKACGKP